MEGSTTIQSETNGFESGYNTMEIATKERGNTNSL